MISVLVPTHCSDYELQLACVLKSRSLLSFDPAVIDFLDAFSKAVLLDDATRRSPEMAAVAHWMRKAHTLQLQGSFDKMRSDRVWVARGVALHFAPANVDSIFLYSWFLSMLAGNGNILRLSQNRNVQLDLLVARINLLLEQERFKAIRDRSLIISYEHNDALTQKLSESCHLRVLWGGDESVRRLRGVPMNPLGSEVVFPNRFSLAALDAEAVIGLDRSQLGKLAANFCNDAYWFDQMACSSPRLMVWVGSQANCGSAQELFWTEIERELVNRGLEYPEVVGVNKLVSAYVAAGMGFADRVHSDISGSVGRIHLAENADSDFRRIECGGGLFFEAEIPELNQIVSILSERDQTLSYFGFKRDDLNNLAHSLPIRAIDRIVPIGAALNFSAVWDGNNLLRSFSREIDLQ
jgi:hypothetical protein